MFGSIRYVYAGIYDGTMDTVQEAITFIGDNGSLMNDYGVVIVSGENSALNGFTMDGDSFDFTGDYLSVWGGYDANGSNSTTTSVTIDGGFGSSAIEIHNMATQVGICGIERFTFAMMSDGDNVYEISNSLGVTLYQNNILTSNFGIMIWSATVTILDSTVIANKFSEAGYGYVPDWSTNIETGGVAIRDFADSTIIIDDGSTVVGMCGGETKTYWGGGGTTYGYTAPADIVTPTSSLSHDVLNPFSSDYTRNISTQNKYGFYSMSPANVFFTGSDGSTTALSADMIGDIFEQLLQNSDGILGGKEGVIDEALLESLLQELNVDALGMPLGDISDQEMKIASILADIMRNPTEEQKEILEAIAALIEDAEKAEKDKKTEEATDELIKAAATILLAQAIPDLLKEGDMNNIMAIFEEMGSEKTQIINQYENSVKLYYTSILKELAANKSLLQLKDLLPNNITEEELAALSAQRIDEILLKIKAVKDKTHTEMDIVQAEAKYRQQFVAPAIKMLQDRIQGLVGRAIQRMYGVLGNTGLLETKTADGESSVSLNLAAK